MSTRISTEIGGNYEQNKQDYYNYANSLIEGMRSGGISETSIANAYKQYNEDCNVSNTYYLKVFYKSSVGGGCHLLPMINMGENNSKPILWRDSVGYTTLFICSNKGYYNQRTWKGKTINNIAKYFSGVEGSSDIYDKIDVTVNNGGINSYSILNKGDNLYNSTQSNWQYNLYGMPISYLPSSLFNVAFLDRGDYLIDTNIPIFSEGNKDKINDWLDNGEYPSESDIDKKTAFKLYIDGLNFPNYHLNWHNENENNEDFLADDYIINLRLCTYNSATMSVDEKMSVQVPFSSGSYDFSWQDILDNDAVYLYWGGKRSILRVQCIYYNGAHSYVSDDVGCILLNNQEQFGDMYDAVITNTEDGSTFEVLAGQGEPEDDYTPADDNDDDPSHEDEVEIETSGALASCYSMTKERLQSLGNFLFSSSFLDNILLINNSPIENILSIKALPFTIGGTTETIKLGNVDTGINGEKCSECLKYTLGSFTINEKYHSFLDYAPFTSVEIYLPFIGLCDLDINVLVNRTITINYIVDCITGSLKVQLLYNSKPLYQFNGTIGVDIPIASSNRAQVELGLLSSGIGAISSIASGNIMGAVYSGLNMASSQYHTNTSGCASANTEFHNNRTCYVIVNRPKADTISSYNSTHGKPCNLSKRLGNLHGMTKVNKNVQLKNISCTEEERNLLRELLTNGIIL